MGYIQRGRVDSVVMLSPLHACVLSPRTIYLFDLQNIQLKHNETLEEVGKIRGFDPERLREIAKSFADACQQGLYNFIKCVILVPSA